MKIGLTYNLKDEISPEAILNAESHEEFDTAHTIDSIAQVFEKNGHSVSKLGWGTGIIEKIKNEKVDFVFNIAEGYYGRNREAHIPAILEAMKLPYSGSDPLTLSLTLDKIITKKIAFSAGIPSPRYRVVKSAQDMSSLDSNMRYPLIVKPAWEGSSKGIYNSSKIESTRELESAVKLVMKNYPDQPVLIEEYVAGREITVGIIGNNPPKIMGIMEVINKLKPGEDFFYSLEVKRDWENLVDYKIPTDLDGLTLKHLKHYALMAFEEFGCRDIARIDFRISADYNIYLLEANPLPGLSPLYADLVIMAKKHGINYESLIMSIFNNALERYSIERVSSKHETL